MSDNGTLRDHLADVITERNELLRQVELLKERIDELMQIIDTPAEN
jgi:hypothetical protein